MVVSQINRRDFYLRSRVIAHNRLFQDKETIRVYAQGPEDIRIWHGDYSDYMADLQRRVRPIRHTPLLRDCVHAGTFLREIPIHQSGTGHCSDGSRHLSAGTEDPCRLSLAALAGADTTRLLDDGLLAAAAMVRPFSCGNVLRQDSIPARKQKIQHS